VTRPGAATLTLFATLARDARLFQKFFAGSLLDHGHLTVRQREIVIDRTTARCGSEYEWGIHIAVFGERAKLTDEQVHSLALGGPEDPCWSEEDRALIKLSDELHERADVCDETWRGLRERFDDGAILELLMLAGFYRTVSYLTNVLQLPLEPNARRLPKNP
jgi:alkylhydroperoxidase family enzyme